MAWSTIRRATQGEKEKLEAAAVKFCIRHDIDRTPGSAVDAVEAEMEFRIYDDNDRRLKNSWLRIARRILGSRRAEGIRYDMIGYHVD